MIEIIPAIIPESLEDLRVKLARIRKIVPAVQIDFVDGKFVPNTQWPFFAEDEAGWREIVSEREGLPYWDDFSFEADCMVKDPKKFIEDIGHAGFSRAIIHFTSTEKLDVCIKAARNFDMTVGVAVGRETSADKLALFVPLIDFIQVMGIAKIGVQGQPFDEQSLFQIKEIRKQFPSLPVSVDGGVTLETAPRLIEAGVTRLVAGSAIFNSEDIKDTMAAFQALTE